MPNNSSSSTKVSKPVKKKGQMSFKTSAKGAKASKVSKDSDKKAEQPLIGVIQGESEQPSIADNTSDTVR